MDINLDNVTTYDSQGNYIAHDLSKAQKIISSYGTVKSRFRLNDARIRRKVFQKYVKLQKNRIHNILHYTSKKIVSLKITDKCSHDAQHLPGLVEQVSYHETITKTLADAIYDSKSNFSFLHQ